MAWLDTDTRRLGLCNPYPLAFNLQTNVGYFDATNRFLSVGRLINHAARGANLLLKKPMKARGRWRIGFVAKTRITPGQELFWDYGFR